MCIEDLSLITKSLRKLRSRDWRALKAKLSVRTHGMDLIT